MVDLRRAHRLPVHILLAAGLAAGVACGGSGSGPGDGVASIKTAAETSNDSDSSKDDKNGKAETDPEEAMLAFARCMREHGVDMPDPDTSGGGAVTFKAAPASGGTRLDADTDKFGEAHEACKDLMGDARPMNLTPEQQQEMQDQALAFSRCMREHGVNMPDPSFGEKGQMMMRLDPESGMDPNDPKFAEAQQACGSAFGPGAAKMGAGVSVGGGGKGEVPRGAVTFGAPAGSTAGGGAK